jgi:hypothetical protein
LILKWFFDCWRGDENKLRHVRGSGFLEGPGLKHLRRDRQLFIHVVLNQQLFEFVDAASPNWHLGDNLVVGVHEQSISDAGRSLSQYIQKLIEPGIASPGDQIPGCVIAAA